MKTLLTVLFVCSTVAVADPPTSRPTNGPASKPSASTKPATRPVATRPATPPAASRPAKAVDPIRRAVAELQREAQTALASKKPFPRTSPDYFTPGAVEVDSLLKALGGPIHQNPRIDAYVKLQLLSAVESFEGEKALPALKAYVLGSPALIALPGMTQSEQQKLNQKAMRAKREDVAQINEEWKKELAPYIEANAIIMAYRDAMRAKIQPPDDLRQKYFHACLEDLSQRGGAGYEIDKELSALTKSILSWAPLAKKVYLKEMQAALKEYASRKPPRVYEELAWSSSKNEATWRYYYAGLPVSKVDKMIEQIEVMIPNAIE